MPTPYLNVTENRAIEEFRKKIENEEGVFSIEKPEPPDILIHTKTSRIIWGDITSVFRTKDLGKFLNQNGLYNPNEPVIQKAYSERFDNYSAYISRIKDEIKKRILEKDSKKSYESFVSQYGKGSLILYVDDPLFCHQDFECLIAGKTSFLSKTEKFSSIYLYMPPSYSIGGEKREVTKVDGLYLL